MNKKFICRHSARHNQARSPGDVMCGFQCASVPFISYETASPVHNHCGAQSRGQKCAHRHEVHSSPLISFTRWRHVLMGVEGALDYVHSSFLEGVDGQEHHTVQDVRRIGCKLIS